jgi:hypothetical protein
MIPIIYDTDEFGNDIRIDRNIKCKFCQASFIMGPKTPPNLKNHECVDKEECVRNQISEQTNVSLTEEDGELVGYSLSIQGEPIIELYK